MSTTTTKSHWQIPSVMESKLRSLRRRSWLLIAFRGLAIAISVLVLAMMIAMTIDWVFVLFDWRPRVFLTLATLLLAVVSLLWTTVSRFRRFAKLQSTAQQVDAAVPQLQHRWSTVAQMNRVLGHDGEGREGQGTAKLMRDQVASEAVAMQSMVDPSRIAPLSVLRQSLMCFAGSGLLLLIFMMLHWSQTLVLLQRFWRPTQAITATELVSLTADQLVPRGESIELHTRIQGIPRSSAELSVRYQSGATDLFKIDELEIANEQFVYSWRADESAQYRFRAGDGQTDWHDLQVIDYPEIGEIQFRLIAPVYTNQKVIEKTYLPRRMKVTEGSELEIAIKPIEPVQKMEMCRVVIRSGAPATDRNLATNEEEKVGLNADINGWYRYRSQLNESVTLQPSLLSLHGLADETPRRIRIDVLADKAPVARVISPTDEESVAEDDKIEIKFEAHDDHAVAKAELIVYDESQRNEEGELIRKEIMRREVPLGDQAGKKHVATTTQLDLSELDLPVGSEVSYAIEVTDNRNEAGSAERVSNPSQKQDRDPVPANQTPSEFKPSSKELAENQKPPSKESSSDSPVTKSYQATKSSQAKASPKMPREGKPESNDMIPKPTNSNQDAVKPESISTELDSRVADLAKDPSAQTSLARSKPVDPKSEMSPNIDSKAVPRPSDKSSRDTPASPKTKSPESNDEPAGDPSSKASESKEPTDTKKSESADARENSPKDQSVSKSVGKEADQKPKAMADRRGRMRPRPPQKAQSTRTNQRKLKIVKKLVAIAQADGDFDEKTPTRQWVKQLDEMLSKVEIGLEDLVEHRIADASRGEQFQILDQGLGAVEEKTSDLREETEENEFAFVGLQLLDISRDHVSPARDRVFAGIRNPNASDPGARYALGHIQRAREQLAALLKRYDQVQQERRLNRSLEEGVEIYEVYIEKRHQLMREARQNRHPLARKMGVIEVDQAYLDRLAEVLGLRRDMLDEFATMLGDDPRLLSRYMDLVKRRRQSLRAQLAEIADTQDDAVYETEGWLEIDPQQQADLWTIIADLRFQATETLAKETAELTERIEKQMPLSLDIKRGIPSEVLSLARRLQETTRRVAMESETTIDEEDASQVVDLYRQLEAKLSQLEFENDKEEDVANFVAPRLIETSVMTQSAIAWQRIAGHLRNESYPGIVATEQRQMTVISQLLLTEMLGIEEDLEQQFQRIAEESVPDEITEMVRALLGLVQGFTLNQAAAAYAASTNDLENTAKQQRMAMTKIEEAEKLFDEMRREVADHLDEYELQDPNIADLRDPTLDEFLARLEREPNIASQLGIPRRRRNLRVLADSMLWQQTASGLLGSSGEEALRRAKKAKEMRASGRAHNKPMQQQANAQAEKDLSDEELKELKKAKELQQKLEKQMLAIQDQMKNPKTPPQQRERMKKMTEQIQRLLKQQDEQSSAIAAWQRLAQADQASAVMEALTRGEEVPDEQWNELFSTLDDGLWQVRGKQPPEQYRKAIEQYQDRLRELLGTAGAES